MIMFAKSLDDDIVLSGNGCSTAVLLLDASPANLGAPTRMFVEPPLTYLYNEVPALR